MAAINFSNSCLVLNNSYQPIHFVSQKRALCLVVLEKAVSLESDPKKIIHSAELSFPLPLVIKLFRYVNPHIRNFRKKNPTKRFILMRDKHRCGYCDSKATTVDHIIPKSRNGTSTWTNMIACCDPCNKRKSNSLISELGWSFCNNSPTVPDTIIFYQKHKEYSQIWSQYL